MKREQILDRMARGGARHIKTWVKSFPCRGSVFLLGNSWEKGLCAPEPGTIFLGIKQVRKSLKKALKCNN